jgi:PQQ-dependent catabolism-associated CXXCW motif protein
MIPVRLLALATLLSAPSLPAAAQAPLEPTEYRLENYRAPTPATLFGTPTLTTPAAVKLWEDKAAIFIDVLPQPPRPANLPPEVIWRPPPRDSIPGAVWLPNVGFGVIAPETDEYFRRALAELTGSDRNRSIVLFCMRDCWMSWNAAKRAMSYGYTAVHWYADGTEGWRESGRNLTRVQPAW